MTRHADSWREEMCTCGHKGGVHGMYDASGQNMFQYGQGMCFFSGLDGRVKQDLEGKPPCKCGQFTWASNGEKIN